MCIVDASGNSFLHQKALEILFITSEVDRWGLKDDLSLVVLVYRQVDVTAVAVVYLAHNFISVELHPRPEFRRKRKGGCLLTQFANIAIGSLVRRE